MRAVCGLLCLLGTTAHADVSKRLFDGGTYVPFGFDMALTYDGDTLGVMPGLELSVVEMSPGLVWGGLVGAGHFDVSRNTGAFTGAIEGGVTAVGLEAGYTVHTDGAQGPRLRAVFPFIFGGSFVGAEHLSDGGWRALIGGFIKWPFGLD